MQMNFREVDTAHFKLREPVEIENGWILELWYKKDRRAEKLLVRTPRTKIAYSAKWFQRKCCYCINLADRDIDDDIQDFWQFVRACDKKLVEQASEKLATVIAPDEQIKFNPSLKNKNLMSIKLLSDAQKNILTSISNCNRSTGSVGDITYGSYADQYVELFGVSVVDGCIFPLWNAHQVVISPHEKVFLSKFLLDEITPNDRPIKQEVVRLPHGSVEQVLPEIKELPQIRESHGGGGGGQSRMPINPSMLLAVRSKLNKTVSGAP